MNRAIFILTWALLLAAGPVWAQNEGGGDAEAGSGAPKSEPTFEMGVHVGHLLPNQINGVTEIMGLGGARAAFRLSPGTFAEGGIIMGNGEGQEWKNIHASIRMDIPVENLLALAYIGADNYYFKGQTGGQKLVFGGHAGGGVQVHLSGMAWFRTEMKFGFSPGTSLYFGFGFVWRM